MARTALLLFMGALFVAISSAGVASGAESGYGWGSTCDWHTKFQCSTLKGKCCWDEYSKKCKKVAGSLLSDVDNCGECGKKCGYEEVCCKGRCEGSYKLKIDPYNCGECGKKCEHGEWCCKGECKDGKAFYFDKDNCGKCGKVCKFYEKCHQGWCKPKY